MFCQNVLNTGREFYSNTIQDIPVKEKRSRTAFTTEQLNYLEQQYKTCPYGEHERLCRIANIIKKPEKVVKIWFQNRRSRERKSNKLSETDKNKPKAPETNKLTPTQISNMFAPSKPIPNISEAQINYNYLFQMAQNEIRSKNFTTMQAVNLHKIINDVRKESHPKLYSTNYNNKTLQISKTKNRMSNAKINKTGLANTKICYTPPKTTEIKPEYNFVYNTPNQPTSSNFFISGNNSAINFASKGLLDFPTKSSPNNFAPKEVKPKKHRLQMQETKKSSKQCVCKPKSKQTVARNTQNPQVPYVIIIPCMK